MKKGTTFRVLQPIILADRQIYGPGAIVDLSHLPPASQRWYLEHGIIETADGEPENDVAVKATPCKNC